MVHRQLMRIHGFSIMYMVLTEMSEERAIVLLVSPIQSPLVSCQLVGATKPAQLAFGYAEQGCRFQHRRASNSYHRARGCRTRWHRKTSEGPASVEIQLNAQLLESWSSLELSQRIPKKKINANVSKHGRISAKTQLDADDEAATTTIAEQDAIPQGPPPAAPSPRDSYSGDLSSRSFRSTPYFSRRAPPPRRPQPPPAPPPEPAKTPKMTAVEQMNALQAIIAAAQAAPVAVPAPPPESPAESSRSASRAPEQPRKRPKLSHEDAEARKEKRYTKAVGDVVVRSMSKYRSQMEHETFKRYAKEVSRFAWWSPLLLKCSAPCCCSTRRRRDSLTPPLDTLISPTRRKQR